MFFICIHQRAGKLGEKPSCGEAQGMEVVACFKKKLKEKKLPIKARAQQAGCLDVCLYGPTIVIYPEGVFYTGVGIKDVDEIIEEHIINNRPVKRLVLFKEKF